MFTGIIEETGRVVNVAAKNLLREFIIQAERVLEDLKTEDSLCVNGVCLTVTDISNNKIKVQAVAETLQRTTLGKIKTGEYVNLERAMTLEKRLGGHIVQGHVDFVSKIKAIRNAGESYVFEFETDKNYLKYIVEKGSVTVNGVSLTVAKVSNSSFQTAVIPYTWQNTVFKYLKPGNSVNIEVDIIAKYVENMLQNRQTGSDLSFDKLKSLGY